MSGAQARMADALLKSTGGRAVVVRVPAPAVAGEVTEQVGLSVPQFQEVELRPVVFRRVLPEMTADGIRYELLVSATAVEELVGTLLYESARVLLEEALGVVVDGELLRVTALTGAEARGETSLYRLQLQRAR